MAPPQVGFAVLYRWRLRSGHEEGFRRAWATVTHALRAERRALGSRLHRAEDGTWVAYAQWPDRATWERSRRLGPVDGEASSRMAAAIQEAFDPILLESAEDLLAAGEGAAMTTEPPLHRYAGARAMVLLHERHLRAFVAVWRRAKEADLPLPSSSDPDYASLEALLHHVLRCARGYMTWICACLDLDDPGIDEAPPVERIEAEASAYLEHVVQCWRAPLAAVPPERFEDREYPSRWGVRYCIDAMLEHAVMHPIRHAFQLERLLEAPRDGADRPHRAPGRSGSDPQPSPD